MKNLDLTRVLVTVALAATGVLLYLLGPDTAHQMAAGAVTGAVAVGSGALRKPVN